MTTDLRPTGTVSGLFRERYPEMVRLADLLGADDPEDIAQEAFARLIRNEHTLEDRLREALAERAALSSIDPGAWDKTVARARRRFRPGRIHLSFAVPAAAAAAIVAIAVAATTLTGGHGTVSGPPAGTGRTPAGATSPQHVPAPPGRGNYLIQSTPPVSAIVRVTGIGGPKTWTFIWFGYQKDDRSEGIELLSHRRRRL
jgi:hypothetical protein